MKEYYLTNKICYRANHLSGKKTLIFIHGLSGSSSAWERYEKHFEKEYNLLVPDLRSHGKSFKPSKYNDYKIKNMAEDLQALVKHEDIRKFILISHSFGNLVSLEFLKRHDSMVEKMVLLSASHDPSKRLIAKILKPFLIMSSNLDFIPIKKQGHHVDYCKYIMTSDWNILRIIDDVRNTTLRGFLYGLLQSYYVDSYDFLSNIKQPTLIIHGDKDTIFPLKHAMEMRKSIKNCKINIIRGGNHIIVLNCFKEVSKLIREFVSEGGSSC